jgi:hypothetical protein
MRLFATSCKPLQHRGELFYKSLPALTYAACGARGISSPFNPDFALRPPDSGTWTI